MTFSTYILPFIALLGLAGCNQPASTTSATSTKDTAQPVVRPVETTYRSLTNKDSIKKLPIEFGARLNILLAINRTDTQHLVTMDSVLIPANITANINQYSPFPQSIPYSNIEKVIFFSYPAQYFAAYEHGRLVRSGPTNMGREKDPTPTGLFYTNWKGADVKSSFNDEWDLKWNFNIINDSGIGFHLYSLPGYPASHSCLRLGAEDAQYLYNWADEWKVKGKSDVVAKGTPVFVFGSYPFRQAKPWWQLLQNPHALDISVDVIKQLVDTAQNNLLAAQRVTDSMRH
jgi:lipoprotein-anchoring transpeptidase ErfK/SrfK